MNLRKGVTTSSIRTHSYGRRSHWQTRSASAPTGPYELSSLSLIKGSIFSTACLASIFPRAQITENRTSADLDVSRAARSSAASAPCSCIRPSASATLSKTTSSCSCTRNALLRTGLLESSPSSPRARAAPARDAALSDLSSNAASMDGIIDRSPTSPRTEPVPSATSGLVFSSDMASSTPLALGNFGSNHSALLTASVDSASSARALPTRVPIPSSETPSVERVP